VGSTATSARDGSLGWPGHACIPVPTRSGRPRPAAPRKCALGLETSDASGAFAASRLVVDGTLSRSDEARVRAEDGRHHGVRTIWRCIEPETVIAVHAADEPERFDERVTAGESEALAPVEPHRRVASADAFIERTVHHGFDPAPQRDQPDRVGTRYENGVADVRAIVTPVGVLQCIPVCPATCDGSQSRAPWRHHAKAANRLSRIRGLVGAPGRIRTSGPQVRSLMLYPAELRTRGGGV
jgi:hypothetical protein